jgi:hypothetical protein
MNTLREALHEYLELRQGLGFKIHDAVLQLPRFVAFMEERQAPSITIRLALEWVEQATTVRPAERARRLVFVCGAPSLHRTSHIHRPDATIRVGNSSSLLVGQSHNECQGNVHAQNIFVSKLSDSAADTLPPNGNWFICHHLQLHSQSVLVSGVNRYSEIRCIIALGGHLANHNRSVLPRKGIRLHDHSWARFAVVSRCCHCYHVAALHPASNSEIVSVHRIASASRERSRAATCLATRFLTALERASGTIKRSSRRPRARRRSRIAFIRSAVCAIVHSIQHVTRYSVTRYNRRIKRCASEVLDSPSCKLVQNQLSTPVPSVAKVSFAVLN